MNITFLFLIYLLFLAHSTTAVPIWDYPALSKASTCGNTQCGYGLSWRVVDCIDHESLEPVDHALCVSRLGPAVTAQECTYSEISEDQCGRPGTPFEDHVCVYNPKLASLSEVHQETTTDWMICVKKPIPSPAQKDRHNVRYLLFSLIALGLTAIVLTIYFKFLRKTQDSVNPDVGVDNAAAGYELM